MRKQTEVVEEICLWVFFNNLFVCLFFGCAGSRLLCAGSLWPQSAGLLFVAVCGLLTAVAPLLGAAHGP